MACEMRSIHASVSDPRSGRSFRGSQPAPGDEQCRLFVAVELSESWRCMLADLTARLRADLGTSYRWVGIDLLHLTVLFLGAVRTKKLPEVEDALHAAAASRSSFRLGGGDLGSFGGRRPRVIWVGVTDPDGVLLALRARLITELDGLGLRHDSAPFRPHITLARSRPGGGPRRDSPLSARGLQGLVSEPLAVEHLTLVRSDLFSSGPRYTVLARVALADALV